MHKILDKPPELQKIKTETSSAFLSAWKILEASFPPEERGNLKTTASLLKKPSYEFFAIYNKQKIIGVLDQWNLKTYVSELISAM